MLIEHLVDVGEDAGGRRAVASATSTASTRRPARSSTPTREFAGARPASASSCCRRATPRRCGSGSCWSTSRPLLPGVYDRLGVLLTPDDIVGESFYNDALPGVVDELRGRRACSCSTTAPCASSRPGFTGRDGEPHAPDRAEAATAATATPPPTWPRSAHRVDGLARDAAALRRRRPAGASTSRWSSPVARDGRLAAPPTPAPSTSPFGNVLGADRKMFETRGGRDACGWSTCSTRRSSARRAVVAERSPELVGDERAPWPQAVGIGAIKYADLSSDRVKRLRLRLGPHAGLRRQHRRPTCSTPTPASARSSAGASVDRATLDAARRSCSASPQERRAGARAARASRPSCAETAERPSPHRLCGYLFDLAQAFTSFYEACPVLKADDEATRASRLALCDLTARTLSDRPRPARHRGPRAHVAAVASRRCLAPSWSPGDLVPAMRSRVHEPSSSARAKVVPPAGTVTKRFCMRG